MSGLGVVLSRHPAIAYDDVGVTLGRLFWLAPRRIAWEEISTIVHHGAGPSQPDRPHVGIVLADVDDYLTRPDVGFAAASSSA